MRIEDTICDYCAKGGGRKKPSWRASDMPGVKTCNFCLRTQEFKHVGRSQPVEINGLKWAEMPRDNLRLTASVAAKSHIQIRLKL